MLNRRVFLEAGLASCSLPWLARADGSAPPLYRVVVDQSFDAGAGFIASVAASGAPVRGIRGDVTELWFYKLAPRWRDLRARSRRRHRWRARAATASHGSGSWCSTVRDRSHRGWHQSPCAVRKQRPWAPSRCTRG
jgi:hypothetical protein